MKSNRGFSLQELTIVTAIMSLLVVATVIGVRRYRENAEDARMQAELVSIHKAMEAFHLVNGRYPQSYAELRPFITIPNFDQRYEINPNP